MWSCDGRNTTNPNIIFGNKIHMTVVWNFQSTGKTIGTREYKHSDLVWQNEETLVINKNKTRKH